MGKTKKNEVEELMKSNGKKVIKSSEILHSVPESKLSAEELIDKKLGKIKDLLTNIRGSSSGASSGEFHVYKQSRRRESERQKIIFDVAKRETDDLEWIKKRELIKKLDQQRTEKKRNRRNKRKQIDKKQLSQKNPQENSQTETKAETNTTTMSVSTNANTNQNDTNKIPTIEPNVQIIETD